MCPCNRKNQTHPGRGRCAPNERVQCQTGPSSGPEIQPYGHSQ